MIKDILIVLLGLLQGGVIFPLALYLGFLTHRDLLNRHIVFGAIVRVVVPLIIMIMWITMSYLAADSLLDDIASSGDIRLKAGRLWVVCTFFGLVALSITMIVLNRMNFLKR